MTVNGQKMSKSRGTGISPMDYLGLGMNAEWMRYYLAAKLNSRVEDVTHQGDFQARVNSDLIASTSTSPAAPPASSSSALKAACPMPQ